MAGQDEQTLRFYETSAPGYTASGPDAVSPQLPAFLDLLAPGSRVLELGCGGGRDAQALLAAGHDVDPTDGAAAMAQVAQARLGRPVRVMRFEELDASGVYDGIWANAALLHVPRPDLPGILARVRSALKSGGLHGATFKAGAREGRDAHDRYFNYLSLDELVQMYRRSGAWTVISTVEYLGGGYGNVQGPWVAILARRRD